ncbi:MAG TPA: PPE family protein [Mycobacterium sp.]|nr:PPE family protein [Mycobacterium sp.]HTX93440.1 PPE family protein [Mycobacterium sp.]
MIPAFIFFPPEINSALMFGGAGPGPLLAAASAWDALAADLSAAAASFDTVVSDVTSRAWLGAASQAMAAASIPYVGWLSAAATQAEAAAAQARAAATAYEAAAAATVPTPAVYANRVRLMTLIATNFLGVNTPAIAMTELEYLEMWLQDVAAMVGYHAAAKSVAATLPSFSAPPAGLAGLVGLVTTPLTNFLSQAAGALSSAGATFVSQVQSVVASLSPAISSVSSLLSSAPVSTMMSVAQIGVYPASALMSPMMALGQGGGQAAPALAAATEVAVQAPSAAGAAVYGLQPLGGLGVASAGLGTARLVGAISVPATWQGSMPMPTYLASSAMSGLASEMPTPIPTPGATGSTGTAQTMPMAMDGRGAQRQRPDGTTRRGGENPHVVQSRPKVVPRPRGG